MDITQLLMEHVNHVTELVRLVLLLETTTVPNVTPTITNRSVLKPLV